jgi:hypothetical protein
LYVTGMRSGSLNWTHRLSLSEYFLPLYLFCLLLFNAVNSVFYFKLRFSHCSHPNWESGGSERACHPRAEVSRWRLLRGHARDAEIVDAVWHSKQSVRLSRTLKQWQRYD